MRDGAKAPKGDGGRKPVVELLGELETLTVRRLSIAIARFTDECTADVVEGATVTRRRR
jgi:hypothetical protein